MAVVYARTLIVARGGTLSFAKTPTYCGISSLYKRFNIVTRTRFRSYAVLANHRVKDTKKQEWRELIAALSQSFHYLKNYSRGYELAALSGEQRKGLLEADADARRAIESRIFIAPRVYHENVLERWQLLAAEKDWNKMVGHWESLHGALILAAHKDVGIKYAAPGAR